jgi:cell division GTPase FtsZ
MSVDRAKLHALLDRIPDDRIAETLKLLEALVADWDVAPAESEGRFTAKARREIEAAEAYFDKGGHGIAHDKILKEFGLK